MLRFLNGFILIGIILLFISIAGLVKGATLLSEPGTPPNPYAWLEYLGAAALMLINGAVSIHLLRQREKESGTLLKGGGPKSSEAVEEEAAAKSA